MPGMMKSYSENINELRLLQYSLYKKLNKQIRLKKIKNNYDFSS